MERQMGVSDDEEEEPREKRRDKQRPRYTARQPPLIQPLRLSAFTQKTNAQLGIVSEDLAQEWVVLFKAISGGKMGEGVPLQIPDTVLLSPSGQPSVWYSTSSSGRVKVKDLMRVSPQAICEAFRTPLQRDLSTNTNNFPAVRRLGFQVDTLSLQQLKMFCTDMRYPDILSVDPTSATSTSTLVRSGLTKGVFCLQRHIPCHKNASFLIVWRHSLVLSSSQQPESTSRTTQSVSGNTARAIPSPRQTKDTSNRRIPRAHSDVFLLTQAEPDRVTDAEDGIFKDFKTDETQASQTLQQNACRLAHLDVEHPESITWKALRNSGFDPDVMAPLLCYMKRVTSEIANCINLGRHTRQASGLVCEFFIGEYNQSVYFSALRGIEWAASAPSWEALRDIDPLSRSLCEFYESTSYKLDKCRADSSSPAKPHFPIPKDKASYYELNPRFPSVHTPFAGEKQWLHRSQLLAPDISPRYIGASVPKIYRGVFQSVLTAHQADSVVRLSLSPQAPSTLVGVRREQPQLSPRSVSLRRRPIKSISVTSKEGL